MGFIFRTARFKLKLFDKFNNNFFWAKEEDEKFDQQTKVRGGNKIPEGVVIGSKKITQAPNSKIRTLPMVPWGAIFRFFGGLSNLMTSKASLLRNYWKPGK